MYVRSLLEFGCVQWCPSNVSLINCIEKVQKRFCRFFSCLNGLNYRSKLFNLCLLSLEARRLRYKLIFLYKILNGYYRLNPNDFFHFSSRSVSCTSNKILMPLTKHKYRSNFFTVDVIHHWNNLSLDERNADSLNSFKNSVSCYFMRCDIW